MMIGSWRLRLGRAASWLFRVHRFGIVDRTFQGVDSPCILTRRLFGHTLSLDASRGCAQQSLYLEGERFVHERFLLRRLLRSGMTVVDVGANIGYYLLLFEQAVGPTGRVVCIEPSPENLGELQLNIDRNGLHNVRLHPVAIGKAAGFAQLRSGINSGIVVDADGAYRVPVCPLDTLVDEHVDFIKIDVEGFEGAVLEGAIQTIRRDRPLLFVEVHPHLLPRFGSSAAAVLDRLRGEYTSVACYTVRSDEEVGSIRRVASRYAPDGDVARIQDVDAFLQACSTSPVPRTFWAVCSTGPAERACRMT